jgi:hypothetical protein
MCAAVCEKEEVVGVVILENSMVGHPYLHAYMWYNHPIKIDI